VAARAARGLPPPAPGEPIEGDQYEVNVQRPAQGGTLYVARFGSDQVLAARAHDQVLVHLYGPDACRSGDLLNFPVEDYKDPEALVRMSTKALLIEIRREASRSAAAEGAALRAAAASAAGGPGATAEASAASAPAVGASVKRRQFRRGESVRFQARLKIERTGRWPDELQVASHETSAAAGRARDRLAIALGALSRRHRGEDDAPPADPPREARARGLPRLRGTGYVPSEPRARWEASGEVEMWLELPSIEGGGRSGCEAARRLASRGDAACEAAARAWNAAGGGAAGAVAADAAWEAAGGRPTEIDVIAFEDRGGGADQEREDEGDEEGTDIPSAPPLPTASADDPFGLPPGFGDGV